MKALNIPTVSRTLSRDFLSFVERGVSPFHVVQRSKQLLEGNGFTELPESSNWQLQPGGRYYLTRSNSSIIAFTVGENYSPNDTGFKIIGAHTDSPCLKLAPFSQLTSQEFRQTAVCTYGGGLWHTWFDRDLTLAGRVVYTKSNESGKSKLHSGLFHHTGAPLLKIPTLAIHLTEDKAKFAPNAESHLKPILSSHVYEQLLEVNSAKNNNNNSTGAASSTSSKESALHHFSGLTRLISEQLQIEAGDIVDLELSLADTQAPGFVGINEEFISSPRIDNLFSSWAALNALLDHTKENTNNQQHSKFVNMICLYDHEECGSQSFQGAGSNMLQQTTERIWKVLAQKNEKQLPVDALNKAYLNSFLISADMAHSVHPNYCDRHKTNHMVKLNSGIVIKTNANQRYATDSASSAVAKVIARKADVPVQEFVVRNDTGCGSTIGPIVSASTGIKAIDVGAASWGMHSIRETCGVLDSYYYLRFMRSFFDHFDDIAPELRTL